MRVFGKWLGRALLMAMLAVAVFAFVKKDEISRLMAVNSLFEADRIVSNFSNMDQAFLHQDLAQGSPKPDPLPKGPNKTLPPGMTDWMADRGVTSLVVLHQGAVVHESYLLGTQPSDLRIGWSLSKSFLSALFGIIVDKGKIASLDDPVTQYVPMLEGGAYDGTTIRHVLNMATGVTFDEDYLDHNSDINRMGRVLALGGLMDEFAADLTDTFTAPGTDWQYVSIDTHVLGMVVRGATQRSITGLMSEYITGPLGVEHAPYYLTDGAGVAFVLGGINMTTRDYARFGQMFAQHGMWQGHRIVPAPWVVASTTASAPTGVDEYGYGYQWWMPHDPRPREYMARGIYGQYLYINELSGIVIALTAADPDFRDKDIQQENIDWFRAITDSLEGE